MKLEFVQELVRSLSPSEKRRLVLSVANGQKSVPKYVQLYKLLQEKRFQRNKDLTLALGESDNGLRKRLRYLFENIMRSLEQEHPHEEDRLFTWARILVEKGQVATANYLLRKARQHAWEKEQFGRVLEYLDFQRQYGSVRENLAELQKEYQRALEAEKTLATLRELHHRLENGRKAMNTDDRIFLDSTMREVERFREMDLGYRARVYLLRIDARYHIYKQQYPSALMKIEQVITHLESRLDLEEEMTPVRIKSYLARVQLLIANEQEAAAHQAIFHLNALPTYSRVHDATIFQAVAQTQLSWAADRGDLDSGMDVLHDLPEKLDQHFDLLQVRRHQRILYNAMRFEFIAGRCHRSLEWKDRLLTLPNLDQSGHPTRLWAMIYELFTYIELREWDENLEALIQRIRRTYKKSEYMYQVPIIAAKWAYQIARNGVPGKSVLEGWKQELHPLVEDRFEQFAFNFFPLDAWIDAKIRQIPLYQVMQEAHARSQMDDTDQVGSGRS